MNNFDAYEARFSLLLQRRKGLRVGLLMGTLAGCGFILTGCGAAPSDDTENEVSSTSQAIEWGDLETNEPAIGLVTSGSGFCTGTLLSPNLVLTAAHCRGFNMAFKIGNDGNGVSYPADAVSVQFGHDEMMLHLEIPVLGAFFVNPLGPPTTYHINRGDLPPIDTVCKAVGFGLHHDPDSTTKGCNVGNGCTSELKRSATVRILDYTDQSRDDTRIKTRGVSGQTDHGDSGGPLLCNGRIAGVLSSGPEWPFPIWTRVSYTIVYPDWVDANLALRPPTVTDSLYMAQGSVLYRVDDVLGNFQPISPRSDDWANTTSIATLNGKVYAFLDGWLVETDPSTGVATKLGAQDWGGDTTLTVLNSSLYATQGNGLWRIDDLTTGAYHRIGNMNWSGATSMVGTSNGRVSVLWIIKGDRLYYIDPVSLAYNFSVAHWTGPTSMAQIDGTPYIAQGNAIYRVDSRFPIAWSRVGADDWTGVTAMTALDGKLLVVANRYLQRVNVDTGASEPLQHGDWAGVIRMAALP